MSETFGQAPHMPGIVGRRIRKSKVKFSNHEEYSYSIFTSLECEHMSPCE